MTNPPLGVVEAQNAEMSRVIETGKINASHPTTKSFKATEDECLALAKRFGIISVQSFEGQVHMIYLKGKRGFEVSGCFTAVVTQECQRSFQPLEQKISEEFKELLLTHKEDMPSVEEELEQDDVIELLEGDDIDYGEIVTQWFALALDPYPRDTGDPLEHIEHDPSKNNPFSALKSVKLQNNEKK